MQLLKKDITAGLGNRDAINNLLLSVDGRKVASQSLTVSSSRYPSDLSLFFLLLSSLLDISRQ